MKTTISAFLLITLLAPAAYCFNEPVNPVIGDISFVSKYKKLPNSASSETLRIQTHLEYVELLLRGKDVSALAETQKQKRTQLLDLLHTYWTAGIFPHNADYPTERKPCFIDNDGRICAVGYLVEQTAGIKIAEAINRRYQYAYITDMNDGALENWIAESGLSKEECAMIQPTYSGRPNLIPINWKFKKPVVIKSQEPKLRAQIKVQELEIEDLKLNRDSLKQELVSHQNTIDSLQHLDKNYKAHIATLHSSIQKQETKSKQLLIVLLFTGIATVVLLLLKIFKPGRIRGTSQIPAQV